MSTQLTTISWNHSLSSATSSTSSSPSEPLPALVPASFHDSEEEDNDENHIPFDIHQYFGLSPGTPICLDSLPDPAPGQKPAYTYATLVKLAIWSSPQRKLTLAGIYEALEKRFSWFKDCENPNAWKTSIRHSLSLLSVFVKLPMDIHMHGKGCNWTVDFSKGDGYKRPRKRGPKKTNVQINVNTSEGSGSSTERSPGASVGSTDALLMTTTEERPTHMTTPDGVPVPLEAASPEPQFRHYRMCTYLYPGQDGSPPPVPSSDVWKLVEKGETAVVGRRERVSRVMRRSSPLSPNGVSLHSERGRNKHGQLRGRLTTANTMMLKSHTSPTTTERGDERYFQPSPASYQAYRAASTIAASQSWKIEDPPSNLDRHYSPTEDYNSEITGTVRENSSTNENVRYELSNVEINLVVSGPPQTVASEAGAGQPRNKRNAPDVTIDPSLVDIPPKVKRRRGTRKDPTP